MEAQRYPDDYDAIIAGAPWNQWTHQNVEFISRAIALESLNPAKRSVITSAVVAQCGGRDGGLLADGYLNDPQRCHFNPKSLLCAGADAPTCLTATEVEAVEKIYEGPSDPATGLRLFPGFERGSEFGWVGFGAFINNLWQNMIVENPSFDFHTSTTRRDVAFFDAKLAAIDQLDQPRPGRLQGARRQIADVARVDGHDARAAQQPELLQQRRGGHRRRPSPVVACRTMISTTITIAITTGMTRGTTRRATTSRTPRTSSACSWRPASTTAVEAPVRIRVSPTRSATMWARSTPTTTSSRRWIDGSSTMSHQTGSSRRTSRPASPTRRDRSAPIRRSRATRGRAIPTSPAPGSCTDGMERFESDYAEELRNIRSDVKTGNLDNLPNGGFVKSHRR